MRKTVEINAHGKTAELEVKELSEPAKAQLIDEYPGNPKTPSDVGDEHLDWFVDVTRQATVLSEREIRSLPMQEMLDVCADAVSIALNIERDTSHIPTSTWMVVTQ